MQKFSIFHADRGDLAAELGKERDGAITGLDENVFFCNPSQTLTSHPH
jgi:hypothetical protein